MVSKARLDLPDPDSPVMTISASRGSSRDMSLRLCSRAPEMRILSSAATHPLYGGVGTTRPGPCWTVEMVARAQYVSRARSQLSSEEETMAVTDATTGYELEGSLLEVCTCNV